MHQQKLFVVSVILFRCGCRDTWKIIQNETTKHFLVGNTKINLFNQPMLTFYTKFNEIIRS